MSDISKHENATSEESGGTACTASQKVGTANKSIAEGIANMVMPTMQCAITVSTSGRASVWT